MDDVPDRRGSSLRRGINSVGMYNGEVQESKIWSQIGKGLCVWLIWKHAESLISHENTLFVLMLFIIAPELVKKFLTMRYGGGQQFTERTTEQSMTKVTQTAMPHKVDTPT